MQPKTIKFKNGGVLIYGRRRVNKALEFTAGFTIGAFAEEIAGTTHFLEHMLFTGTTSLKETQIADKLSFLNANFNALTSEDSVYFKYYCSKKTFKDVCEITSDMMLNTIFLPDRVEKERGVIIEESKIINDQERKWVYSNIFNMIYGKPLQNAVIGTAETIGTLKQDDFKKFVKSNFNKDNFIATVYGNLSLFRAKRAVKKYFLNKLPSGVKNTKFALNNLELIIESKVQVYSMPRNKVILTVSIPFVGDRDYKLNALQSFIFVPINAGGRLHKKLRIDNNLAYQFSCTTFGCPDNSVLTFDITTSAKNIKEVIVKINELLCEMRNSGITKNEFDFVKNRIATNEDKSLPRLEGVHSTMKQKYIYNLPYVKWSKRMKIRKNAKIDEINELYKNLLTPKCVYIGVVGTVEDGDLYTVEEVKKLFNVTK